MTQSFSIAHSRVSSATDSALRDEIQTHTQNAVETTRILSAIQRFGTDPSIEHFELIPAASRGFRGTAGTSWTVRAFRKPAPGAAV